MVSEQNFIFFDVWDGVFYVFIYFYGSHCLNLQWPTKGKLPGKFPTAFQVSCFCFLQTKLGVLRGQNEMTWKSELTSFPWKGAPFLYRMRWKYWHVKSLLFQFRLRRRCPPMLGDVQMAFQTVNWGIDYGEKCGYWDLKQKKIWHGRQRKNRIDLMLYEDVWM
jgi:hypothetical protein